MFESHHRTYAADQFWSLTKKTPLQQKQRLFKAATKTATFESHWKFLSQ